MLARANKPCSVCLGSKWDRADAMRGRLHVIRAAEPTVFRYYCARGMKIPPAAPAKKLQRFETLRLLWRRDSVCSDVIPQFLDENLPPKPSYGMASEWSKLLVRSSDFLFLVQQCH